MKELYWRGGVPLLIALVTLLIPPPTGLTGQNWHLFGIFFAMIVGFITRPFPMGAVCIIGLCLISITKTLTPSEILVGFSSNAIWLIVMAFFFSRAFLKTGLGKRIAYTILAKIGNHSLTVGYAFALSDLVLCLTTPSSAARAGGILFPIILSVSHALDSRPGPTARKIGAYLIQLVYQTEGVTCALFLTAMAANPLMAEFAQQTAGVAITWTSWALAAAVPGLIAFLIIPLVLYFVYPPSLKAVPYVKKEALDKLKELGPLTKNEYILLLTFVLALLLWSTAALTGINPTTTAIIAISVLLITQVLEWSDILHETGAWDTLIWMSSLVGLAGLLAKKGFIPWFSENVAQAMTGLDWTVVLGILVLAYMYSQYFFASLTAHAAAMYSGFLAVAVGVGAPPLLAALSLAFTANICLGLTHYSAACGGLYFGAGYVPLKTWWSLGLLFSVIQLLVWIGIGSVWWKLLGFW